MAAVLCTSAIAGKGDPVAGRDKADAERCLECHGAAGVGQGYSNGEQGKFARLSGQQQAYIVKQVEDFRSGKRKHDFMAMMARSISDTDLADIAAYFASQPAMPASAANGGAPGAGAGAGAGASAGAAGGGSPGAGSGTATRAGASVVFNVPPAGAGQQLYQRGDGSRRVAACAACHGAAGQGVAGVAPVIGGQGLRYLAQQLHDWRSGARRNSPGGAMNQAAAPLSDAEIEALAQYVSEM